jgi:hypothetical protein
MKTTFPRERMKRLPSPGLFCATKLPEYENKQTQKEIGMQQSLLGILDR